MMQKIKSSVRGVVEKIAVVLNRVTGGKLTPNHVTWLALFLHLPIAWLIASNYLILAGFLVFIIGLFDTLDGSLARLQGRVSNVGGFLDAVTDRLKELLIYSGIGYLLVEQRAPAWTIFIALLACGLALTIPFIKSKGETFHAISGKKLEYSELNRVFGGGLLPYEVRIALLAVALLAGLPWLYWILLGVAVLELMTVAQRLFAIMKFVEKHEN